jgi:hypothetical protein
MDDARINTRDTLKVEAILFNNIMLTENFKSSQPEKFLPTLLLLDPKYTLSLCISL